MTDEIPVCPEHDTARVERFGNGDRGPDADGDGPWYCEDHGHHFDEPDYRERVGSASPKRGMAADLAKIGERRYPGEHDDETITVCPDCGSSRIRRRSRPNQSSGAWWCRNCPQNFEEPAKRKPRGTRKQDQDPTNGLAADLAEMDPDEVGT